MEGRKRRGRQPGQQAGRGQGDDVGEYALTNTTILRPGRPAALARPFKTRNNRSRRRERHLKADMGQTFGPERQDQQRRNGQRPQRDRGTVQHDSNQRNRNHDESPLRCNRHARQHQICERPGKCDPGGDSLDPPSTRRNGQ